MSRRKASTRKDKLVKALYGPMTSRKFPRIEIDQRAYDGLLAEGILQHRTVRDIATEAILSHISTEAIRFIDHITTMPQDIATERPQDHKITGRAAIDSKRKRLADNPDALAQIKELWAGGLHNGAKIAREIGYPRATVAENIKKMKDRGDLPG